MLNSAYGSPARASAATRYNWIYGFQGGRYDPSTGLYRFGARDYSPVLGRWMEQDPEAYVDGANAYQMELGSPLGNVDPAGTDAYIASHHYNNLPDGRTQLIIEITLYRDQTWSWFFGNGDQERISILHRAFVLPSADCPTGRHLISLFADMCRA